MASDKVVALTDGDFEKTIGGSQPVLIDFWAEWCGPCRVIAPTIEAIAADFDGRAVVCKMNVDENPDTPIKYGIRAIPTLLIFKGGALVEQIVGLTDKASLTRLLDRHV
jgi:thioredoxin 1